MCTNEQRLMTETRGERKERTRRAILDAALELCEDSSLVALSLRQVAKEVGIVPTAFYRHFDSHRGARPGAGRRVGSSPCAPCCVTSDAATPTFKDIVDRSRHGAGRARARPAAALRIHRSANEPPGHRPSGSAIGHQIELFERELATDLDRLPGTDPWSADDLRILSVLIVTAMVATAEDADRRVDASGSDRGDSPHPAADGARRRSQLAVVPGLSSSTSPSSCSSSASRSGAAWGSASGRLGSITASTTIPAARSRR